MTTSELKNRISNLIAECETYSTTWGIGDRLRALLRDLEAAEPPKPTGEPGWARETARMINSLTPDIKGKAFDPDWFLLWQRLEEAERCIAQVAEIPKPTEEQLKAIGKVFRDNEPKEVFADSLVWADGPDYPIAGYLYACSISPCLGKLRWHLKDAPEHFDCGGCKDRISTQYHSCGYMCADWMHCVRTSSLLRCDWESKKPKSRPRLVPYPIIGGKGNELWLVQRPAGAIALYKVVGRKDFAYIETEIGDKFISLQAFDDPPRKCWFRKTKQGETQ